MTQMIANQDHGRQKVVLFFGMHMQEMGRQSCVLRCLNFHETVQKRCKRNGIPSEACSCVCVSVCFVIFYKGVVDPTLWPNEPDYSKLRPCLAQAGNGFIPRSLTLSLSHRPLSPPAAYAHAPILHQFAR